MFQIVEKPIDGNQLKLAMADRRAGAQVVFEGWVRDHNAGLAVSSLEYETFEDLARKEAEKIIEEAREKFDILGADVVHRVGHLNIGEIAVWIGVTSKHRDAGFRACRFLIDEIKVRLPIWKKENYQTGKAQWVNCQGCSHHAHIHYNEANYYEKQLLLEEISELGQKKLKNSRVLVVGAGGLGCPALTYLAAAGVGEITICDGDRLEVSNLHRQTLYSFYDINEPKALLAKKRLQDINPFVRFQAIVDSIEPSNVREIVAGHDLVLDCTDNFDAKFLLNDTCYSLRIPLVQASIYRYEGQIQTFRFDRDTDCLRCVWSKTPESNCVGSCVEVGVLGVVAGILGTMQATDAIKVLLGWDTPTESKTLLVDLMDWKIDSIQREKSDTCLLCSENSESEIHAPEREPKIEIDLDTLKDTTLSEFQFVDIRRFDERNVELPWEKFLVHQPFLPDGEFRLPGSHKPVVLVCAKGIRSQTLTKRLRKAGVKDVFSVRGGISSIQKNWDRIMRQQSQ